MGNGFRISARALRQLGAELITSDEIALNELIKNALDANASRVIIDLINPFLYPRNTCIARILNKINNSPSNDLITNKDSFFVDGVSDEIKEEFINGIIELVDENDSAECITSYVNNFYDKECHIRVEDDGCGMDSNTLQNSFLVIGTPGKWIEKQSNQDSKLLGEKGVGRLSMMRLGKAASVISGVSGQNHSSNINFDWSLFDDPSLYLEDISIPVHSNYRSKEINASGTQISINSLYSHWDAEKVKSFIFEYLRRLQNPFSKKRKFPIEVRLNNEPQPIPGIFSWFKEAANFSAHVSFSVSEENAVLNMKRELTWRGKSSAESRIWEEADLLRELGCDKDILVELGAFDLDLLWFNRSDLQGASIDKSVTEIKTELNLWCGGYAIYRDNFRIGMTGSLEDDWLKVDTGSLKSSGFSFNRYQTVGSISISQKKNPKLIDAANREKLIGCEHLSMLKQILTELVNKDLKSHIEFFKENEARKIADEATAEQSLDDARDRLKSAYTKMSSLKKVLPKDKESIVAEIEHVLKTQHENIRKYEKAVNMSREQRIEVLELAGLGMVVDKIIHELARLTSSTVENLKRLENNNNSKESASLIRIIREQLKVTNKRIRTVDSLSPSGRNRKEIFDISKTIRAVLDGFSGRFERHQVDVKFMIDGILGSQKECDVNMVVGLVALVLENLLSNSIYWLQQSTTSSDGQRIIEIDLDTQSKTLLIRDNGPGVDPSNKDDIFKAYYTGRAKGKGLGLFICREIAEYHKCAIYLDSEVDFDGRLRNFILELPKD
ncbi:sensor histidine kinase [Rheinheimera sediminis]|uniref:ATP-binding protein n=1 Tax=Rheinheimera sp. YQF-1 TaxID=2499626 RepID=UPI000FD6E044|nr:sensor histidine kinase [Rheinheimera sp. YQF-1]RVT45630.1 sensor histidine kinase [Rheinheimera sp. YQF-1]